MQNKSLDKFSPFFVRSWNILFSMTTFRIRFINSGKSFVGRGIDWVTDSLMDHTEIIMDSGDYLGARSSGGVMVRNPDYCKVTWERRYAIPCTDQQLANIMAFAISKIGVKYNFSDITGLLFKDRHINNPNGMICSQFVLESAQAGPLEMLNVLPGFDYLITPETLHLSSLLIGNCYYRYVS